MHAPGANPVHENPDLPDGVTPEQVRDQVEA